MEFVDEGQVIRDYGATVPDEFGGVYGEELVKFVAMFTANLPHHLAELRARLPFPENVRVVPCERRWRDVEQQNEEVKRRLMYDRRHPGVSTVGIGMHEGEFVVVVGIDPFTEDAVREVRHACEPFLVNVRHVPRPQLLSDTPSA